MKVFLLPFGKIKILQSNIAEVIINDGVVIDLEMVYTYRHLLQSHLEAPFSLLSAEMATQIVMDINKHNNWNIKIFRERKEALDWLYLNQNNKNAM